MNDELLNRARELLALRDKIPVSFGDVMMDPHDVADTIAALLAEVERLRAELDLQIAGADGARVYAVQQAHRAEAAEAKLRELASAEPVAWQSGAHPSLFVPHRDTEAPFWIPLIRRPEMQK